MATPSLIGLGLGSSDRDALGWLRRAVAALKAEPGLRILSASPVYESDALLPAEAPPSWNVPYLNLALSCELTDVSLTPLELLDRLKAIEGRLGRRERERWAPREIDIDLLVWSGVRLQTPRLTLPHPGLLDRPFALLPLAEVAPQLLRELPEARQPLSLWRAPGAEVPFRTRKTLKRLTELVAILNLTPDSFSDDGLELNPDSISRAARTAIESGASVLDFGAESTRPGAAPVSAAEEWRRLEPAFEVLKPLRAATPGLKLSLDTRNPATLERALERAELDWLNDVTGFASERMRELARGSSADLVVMHSLSVPPRREETLGKDGSAVDAILSWGRERLETLSRLGIEPRRVILDPGVGFGKTVAQNFELLRHAWRLHAWGTRILIGHSRKSFLSSLHAGPGTAPSARERDLETAILSAALADQGIEYLRVHDPASQARALRLSAAWDGSSRYEEPAAC